MMVTGQDVVHVPQVFVSLDAVRRETAVSHKRLLLPYADIGKLAETIDPAMQMASDTAAELILLRVCHRQPLAEREDIFSELKGIQARSQLHNVALKIDTTVGESAESIAQYASAHAVDLVLVAEGDERMQDSGEEIAAQVSRRANCDSVLLS